MVGRDGGGPQQCSPRRTRAQRSSATSTGRGRRTSRSISIGSLIRSWRCGAHRSRRELRRMPRTLWRWRNSKHLWAWHMLHRAHGKLPHEHFDDAYATWDMARRRHGQCMHSLDPDRVVPEDARDREGGRTSSTIQESNKPPERIAFLRRPKATKVYDTEIESEQEQAGCH